MRDAAAAADAAADEARFNTPLPFFQNGAGDNMVFGGKAKILHFQG